MAPFVTGSAISFGMILFSDLGHVSWEILRQQDLPSPQSDHVCASRQPVHLSPEAKRKGQGLGKAALG